MNIIGLFWAFHDLSSVSGVIEKLKSLMTLKKQSQGFTSAISTWS